MFNEEEITPEQRKKTVEERFLQIRNADTSGIQCASLKMTPQELEALVDILKTKNFDSIDLRFNGINAVSIESIQKIILNNSSLKEINLEGNLIDDEAISKLLSNKEVCSRLSHINIKFALNRFTEAGLEEGAKYMSVLTVGTMTRNPGVRNSDIIHKYRTAVADQLKEESKDHRSQFRLFKELNTVDELKDNTKADKIQKIDTTITGPYRKNS